MEIGQFKEKLHQNNGLFITDDYILFNDYELLSLVTNNSKQFDSLEDVLSHKLGEESIKNIIEATESFDFVDTGGRGSSSSVGTKIFGGQRARGKRIISAGNGNSMPAYMNTLISAKSRSVDKIAKAFGKKTLNELKEYSASLDEDGFAHSYSKGNKNSTAHLVYENGYAIHNHPTKDKNGRTVAWNLFSKQDLQNTALDKTRGTIVVSNGSRTVYKFTKTHKFNSKAFIKGLNSARGKTSDYDKEVDSWLKKNQKTYGYKYTKSKF